MVAQRLREAWTTKRSVVERLQGAPEHERGVRHEAPNTAQRNVAEKTFCAFSILYRAESLWFANPWQTPLTYTSRPCFSRPDIRMAVSPPRQSLPT
jgi:hypothetical protein